MTWFFNRKKDINEITIDNISDGLFLNLKKHPEEWKITSDNSRRMYKEHNLSNYTFCNENRIFDFTVRMSYDNSFIANIEITKPIQHTLTFDNNSSMDNNLCKYLFMIWNNKDFDTETFLLKHLTNKHGFKIFEIEKNKINEFNLKLMCYSHCENDYFINPNNVPEPPKYMKSYSERAEWYTRKTSNTAKYNNYKCWFESEADAVTIKLLLSGSK